METLIVFFQLIGMAILITLVMVLGFWCGYKLVDIFSGGEVSRLFGGK